MLARPISYGMGYENTTEYEGVVFTGTMTFYPDGGLVNKNSNFDEEMNSFYYYKDGYAFFTVAETEEAYREEIAYIDENFDIAISTGFYSGTINSFCVILEGVDGYTTVYTCHGAIAFAAALGALEAALIGLTVASLVLRKKETENQ